MTGQVKMFTSLVDDAGDHEQVSFGDNSKGRISRLGEISLTNDLSLSNVLFEDSCSYNTSRDVVITDVTLTSLKTPEWSQLVFCDDFVMILFWSLWWCHICSSVMKLVFPS
jgi:hypothetical protein